MIPTSNGALFVDNLTIAGADRLLQVRYDDASRYRRLLPGVLRHDLVNLAQLVESLVCHEVLHVNADFVDIWNRDIEKSLLSPLRAVVVPIHWDPRERLEAEKLLAADLPSFGL